MTETTLAHMRETLKRSATEARSFSPGALAAAYSASKIERRRGGPEARRAFRCPARWPRLSRRRRSSAGAEAWTPGALFAARRAGHGFLGVEDPAPGRRPGAFAAAFSAQVTK